MIRLSDPVPVRLDEIEGRCVLLLGELPSFREPGSGQVMYSKAAVELWFEDHPSALQWLQNASETVRRAW